MDFFVVPAFVRAPLATLRFMCGIETDVRGRLREEAALMRRLRHQPNTSICLTRKTSLQVRLCIFAVGGYTALHYTVSGWSSDCAACTWLGSQSCRCSVCTAGRCIDSSSNSVSDAAPRTAGLRWTFCLLHGRCNERQVTFFFQLMLPYSTLGPHIISSQHYTFSPHI